MKNLKQLSALIALGGLFLAHSASALITLTPSSTGMLEGDDAPTNLNSNSNCEPGCVATAFGIDVNTLNLLYKADVGGSDEGSFASSYSTVFSNSGSDPSDALISYVSGPVITCTACYLAIKDGNHAPYYYFYNLLGWDGTEQIQLQDFWPNGGAISHVSIWGGSETSVPEPATLGLIGLGLLGVVISRRRKTS